jgi:hypothetical protein
MGSDCRLDRHLTPSNKRAKNLKLLLCALALGVYFGKRTGDRGKETGHCRPQDRGNEIGG